MKKTINMAIFSTILLSTFIHAEDNIKIYNNLNEDNKKSFLLGVKKAKNDITIEIKKREINIPVAAYLLMLGLENEAIEYIENNPSEIFKTFNYMDNESSDMVIAIENGFVLYFNKAISLIENPNKRYKYNGRKNFSLMVHLSLIKDEYVGEMTKTMLNNGGFEKIKLDYYNNAKSIAYMEDNINFLRAIKDFNINLINNKKVLFSNTYSYEEYFYKDKVAKILLEDKLEKLKPLYNKMYSAWVKMIELAYNEAADILYQELIKDPSFDINKISEKGLNPLMAASLSNIYGGNVEYAVKLIERGANVGFEIDGINLAQLAISKDNFKLVNLYLEKGLDYKSVDEYGLTLLELSFDDPISIKSAYIIDKYYK
jgi:hypothetical protein